jgi:feruloyl esterase
MLRTKFILLALGCTTMTTIQVTDARAQERRAADCDRLAQTKRQGTTIVSVEHVAAGQLKDLPAIPSTQTALLPSFCRVVATLKPSVDSNIKIEVWLPVDTWNGRLQSVGNGGLAGSIVYPGLANALKDGYAAASTDTGHTGTPVSGEWALNHPEKIIDFGHRAVHEMTLTAKALIKNYYGRAQHHAYWNGCSEGGNQGLHEAQRYPLDYDGIVAGAPANYMTHLQAGGMWISHAIHMDPSSFIAASKLPAINQAVLDACDEIDGLKDGIVDDPRACAVDLARLKCSGGETDQCLTVAQLNGLAKLYAGAKNPHTAEQIFPGYMQGSELEWSAWIVGADTPPKNRQHLIADNLFKYMVFNNVAWDWKTFDFAKDVAHADQQVGVVNSINPDLLPFKKRGGKLLQYHGWYDPAISPLNSINYFSSVQQKIGSTKDFYRLFMLPGVAHCGGGPGASDFDRMQTIVQWVEEGKAPDRLVASRSGSNGTTRTRLLCPHPLIARYQGKGNSDDAANFTCVSALQ